MHQLGTPDQCRHLEESSGASSQWPPLIENLTPGRAPQIRDAMARQITTKMHRLSLLLILCLKLVGLYHTKPRQTEPVPFRECPRKVLEMVVKYRGHQCASWGCNKRSTKTKAEQLDNRSDSDGSSDEESYTKRQYPRTFHK